MKIHQESPTTTINKVYISTKQITEYLLVEIQPPRTVKRQQYRLNPSAKSREEYLDVGNLIQYPILISLKTRFSKVNLPAYDAMSRAFTRARFEY